MAAMHFEEKPGVGWLRNPLRNIPHLKKAGQRVRSQVSQKGHLKGGPEEMIKAIQPRADCEKLLQLKIADSIKAPISGNSPGNSPS
jgi:hypothetical protein